MMCLLIEEKITQLFSESGDFEDSMMHKKRSLNAQPQNTFCVYWGFGEPPTSSLWQWIATNIACSFYIKQKRKIFSKDSIASLSTTSFGKQGFRIYKAVMLVGAMPQTL